VKEFVERKAQHMFGTLPDIMQRSISYYNKPLVFKSCRCCLRKAVIDHFTICAVVTAGLNEVYSGGLASYSIVNMIIAHLQCEGFDARNVIAESAPLPGPAATSHARSYAEATQSADDDECIYTTLSSDDSEYSGNEEECPADVAQPAGRHWDAAGIQLKIPEKGMNGAASESRQGEDGELVSYLEHLSSLSYHPFDLGLLLTSFLHRSSKTHQDCIPCRKHMLSNLN
jgi:hypothetical protein